MKLSVDATAVRHARVYIDHMGPAAKKRAGIVVTKCAYDIEALAKSRVPVDTGYLRSTIDVTLGIDNLVAVIGPSANYGAHVEFGTAKMKPRPYMRPAFDAVTPIFERKMREVLERVFE